MSGVILVKLMGGIGAACMLYAGIELWLARQWWKHDRQLLRAIHGDLDRE